MAEQNQRSEKKDLTDRVTKQAIKAWEMTEEWAEVTTQYVRLRSAEAKLRAEYENLGKLSYRHLRKNQPEGENIERSLDQIKVLRERVIAIRKEISTDQKARAARKAMNQKNSHQ